MSLLEIHGTADMTIAYTGGSIGVNTFPSAETSVSDWVTFDKCGTTPDTTAAPIDPESTLAGSETHITNHAGCKSGTGVSLRTIEGGGRILNCTPAFIPDVINFSSRPRSRDF